MRDEYFIMFVYSSHLVPTYRSGLFFWDTPPPWIFFPGIRICWPNYTLPISCAFLSSSISELIKICLFLHIEVIGSRHPCFWDSHDILIDAMWNKTQEMFVVSNNLWFKRIQTFFQHPFNISFVFENVECCWSLFHGIFNNAEQMLAQCLL